jgi:hypothetical protein
MDAYQYISPNSEPKSKKSDVAQQARLDNAGSGWFSQYSAVLSAPRSAGANKRG